MQDCLHRGKPFGEVEETLLAAHADFVRARASQAGNSVQMPHPETTVEEKGRESLNCQALGKMTPAPSISPDQPCTSRCTRRSHALQTDGVRDRRRVPLSGHKLPRSAAGRASGPGQEPAARLAAESRST